MFALGIRYLNGWAMAAADGPRKESAEWPPHPDRVFMALAAAWFETGEDPDEGDALRWIETLPPPDIAASDATTRANVVSYVPVNDVRAGRRTPSGGGLDKLKGAGLAILPEYRPRQPRGFPVAVPRDPTVYLIWSDADPSSHRGAAQRLAAEVTHIGHSASFVQVWVADEIAVDATWEATDGIVTRRLRIPVPGRLDGLKRLYNREPILEYADLQSRAEAVKGKDRKRLKLTISQRFGASVPVSRRPVPIRWQGYRRPGQETESATPRPVFDHRLIVLAVRGRSVSLPATLKLTHALRGALLSHCAEQPPPEWLTGHGPDGVPTTKPHMALFPLPFVGASHADGRILGLALAPPQELDVRDLGQSLGGFIHEPSTGLPREHRLFDGRWFECAIELETRERPPRNLIADTWTRRSRVWASVTPIVLNRHFDGKDKWERAAESVQVACEHIGLPRPREVLLHPVSLVEGVPHVKEFPQLARKSDGGRCSQNHAVIVFEEAVCGPVLVGAGRFRGYGLCRPLQ